MKRTNRDACEAWEILLELLFSQRAHLPPLAAEFQLSPAQCHVLRAIKPGYPMPMSQLADTLACDASNVTGLVDRLESRGLIRRLPSEKDRRVKVVDLTDAGSQLRSIVLERMTKPPDSLHRLSLDEQRTLVKILRRLLD